MNHCSLSYRSLLATLLLTLGLMGCGSGGASLVPVEGKVTMDGQPLANATVVFEPDEGRSSIGRTDASGAYTMRFTATKDGALRGHHTVSISTYRTEDLDSEIAAQRETVPSKYNLESTLDIELPTDSPTVDFELSSDGDVVQPNQLARRRSRSSD